MLLSPTLEALRIPDAVLGEAYEGTDPQQRAWIKTTLALVESVYTPLPSCTETRRESSASGFVVHYVQHTVPWVLLLIGENYPSAVRLAAAIMSARLAGVEDILAVCLGNPETLSPAVLSALELTGVEHSFTMPDPSPLFGELEPHGSGRVLCFGAELPSPFPCWQDHPPRLLADNLPAPARWAHPDALLGDAHPQAHYTGQTAQSPLSFGPSLEGCWIHPDLPPAFFTNVQRTFSFLS